MALAATDGVDGVKGVAGTSRFPTRATSESESLVGRMITSCVIHGGMPSADCGVSSAPEDGIADAGVRVPEAVGVDVTLKK
jgi:hypothetical protein